MQTPEQLLFELLQSVRSYFRHEAEPEKQYLHESEMRAAMYKCVDAIENPEENHEYTDKTESDRLRMIADEIEKAWPEGRKTASLIREGVTDLYSHVLADVEDTRGGRQ